MAEEAGGAGGKRKAEGEAAAGGDASRARREEFELHERLAADCVVVKDLVLCRVLLLDDASYPWTILVPRQNGITEAHQLSRADQHLLQDEIAAVASAVQGLGEAQLARTPWLKPVKMNVAALGNMVPQLHVHVIGRNPDDKSWPAPVWGKHPAVKYTPEQRSKVLGLLDEVLSAVIP